MKLILIHPPWADVYGNYKAAAKVGVLYPPLGLCYLASSLEKGGHDVKIIDAEVEGMDIPKLLKIVKSYSPDLVGITSTTPIFHQAKKLAEGIKKEMSIPIVIGGPHTTVMPEQSMAACNAFDYGIYGEGERTISEFTHALEDGETLNNIEGLLFRANGKVVKNKPVKFEPNLDAIPFPNRSLLDIDKYLWSVPKKGIVKFTTIMTSRGCPFNCIFCSQRTMFGTNVRYRTPGNILDEIEHIVNDLKINHIQFIDDTLTLKKDRVYEICKGILERGINVTWEGWTRANSVDEEMLRLMKRAGFIRVAFGIESGNPDILKVVKKGVTLEQVKNAFKIAKKVGLETRGSVMLGHPYETKKTAMDTLNFIKNLKDCDQVHLNITTPYPGTELYRIAQNSEGGMRLLTNDFSEYKRYGDAVIEVNDLTREDLIRYQRKGFLMFYLKPRRIWYNLKRAGLKAGVKNSIAFLKSII